VKSATSKRVDLSWTGTGSSYQIQRAPLGGSYTTIQTVNSTTASDTQFDPATTYQYQIVATGLVNSAPSNSVTVGPPPTGFSTAAPAPLVGGTPAPRYGEDLSMILDGNGDPALAFLQDDPNQDNDFTDGQLLFRSWNRAQYRWNPVVKVATVGDA